MDRNIEIKAIEQLSMFEKSVVFRVDELKKFYQNFDANKIDEDEEDRTWTQLRVEIHRLLTYIRNTQQKPEYEHFSKAFKSVADDIMRQYKDLDIQ